MSIVSILWDLDDEPDGNVQHVAEHGLTKEEVDRRALATLKRMIATPPQPKPAKKPAPKGRARTSKPGRREPTGAAS